MKLKEKLEWTECAESTGANVGLEISGFPQRLGSHPVRVRHAADGRQEMGNTSWALVGNKVARKYSCYRR